MATFGSLQLPSFLSLILIFSSSFPIEAAPGMAPHPRTSSRPSRFIRASCASARYPRLCVRTLSTASSTTPSGLAQAAVSASLSRARRSSAFLSHLRTSSSRERGALRDCVEQLSDSTDQLRRTLVELLHLRPGTFRWQMSNAQTWVSAALTNEDTCLEGFRGIGSAGVVKAAVGKKVAGAARMTSNALYLINRLASTRP